MRLIVLDREANVVSENPFTFEDFLAQVKHGFIRAEVAKKKGKKK